MKFPLIYCNGDSYTDNNYHQTLHDKICFNVVGNYCNGFVINKSMSGSCNRRIIRTTLHDVISQRKLNPDQKIIALIGLSFELRSELWVEHLPASVPEESNFKTHQFTGKLTWREDLLNNISIDTKNTYNLDEKFFDFFSRGKAYFYSPYAERINLLMDLIMLRSVLESINVDFLIFQNPKAEKLDQEYLLDFFKNDIASDNRFLDFENFSFCSWCCDNKFVPLDYHDRPEIGHYGADAHEAFAKQILIPKLQELKIL